MTEIREGGGDTARRRGSALEVFWVALRLGLTSFGGPVAHIGYFQDEYVERRRWVDEATFADLVALSQSFPGAASSQLGLAVGMIRGGLRGGIAAWLGFTLPSAVIMTVLGLTASRLSRQAEGWIHGLVVVAVPVVGLAVWKLWRRLAPDPFRSSMAAATAIVLITYPSSNRATTVLVILAAGVIGWRLLRENVDSPRSRFFLPFGRRTGITAAAIFIVLLVALPVARSMTSSQVVDVADAFYGTGALVFGGGPVVLPLLESEVVETGWVDEDTFIAGFGAAQAIPGPMFTFSAYLGAVMAPEPDGIPGAMLALSALFLPSILIVVATLPSLVALRTHAGVQAALRGVNAAVVGLLLAALYDPLWSSAILEPSDFGLALVAFALLAFWRLPPWVVVLVTAGAGGLLAAL